MRFLLALIGIIIVAGLPQIASAQSINGYDLIAAVNALRTGLGLVPYQIDAGLMAYAQEHTDYQAANQKSTHLHSDGSLPNSLGLSENVAVLDQEVASVDIVVNQIWVDWGHRHVMTEYATGSIGAGVALSSDGQYYFTINVRPGEEVISNTPAPGTSIPQQDTLIPISPLVTSMPREDGVIIHKVGYGQTLWSIAIAYGVKINDIRRLNNIADDSTSIYPDQELLIGYISTSTPTPKTTPSSPSQTLNYSSTQFSPTNTPALISTQAPPVVETSTSSPTNNPTNKNRSWAVFLAIGVLILAALAFYGYWKLHKDNWNNSIR